MDEVIAMCIRQVEREFVYCLPRNPNPERSCCLKHKEKTMILSLTLY